MRLSAAIGAAATLAGRAAVGGGSSTRGNGAKEARRASCSLAGLMSSVSLRLIRSATCGARDQPKGWQGISIARMPHHVRFRLDHRWITSPVAAVRFCYRTPVDVSMDRMQL